MTRKISFKNIIIIALLCLGIGFFLAYEFFISPVKDSNSGTVIIPSSISDKLILKDIIIDKILEKHELITMEVDLSQKITIDNSWGSLKIFKKVSNINYICTGTYTIDFVNLKAKNIEIKDKIITLKLPKPEIKYINIDENKTTCESTEKGVLRFGEIKITPAENQQLHQRVSEEISVKMMEPELYDKAIKSSKEAAKVLISEMLAINNSYQYEVNVEFDS